MYGLLEKQFARTMERATSMRGRAGENLLILLERRLDNVVFRLGLAPTIPAARQLVRHGHITVNGNRLNIPSYHVRVGDKIAPREKSRNHAVIVESVASPSLSLPDYVDFDSSKLEGTFKHVPAREDIPLEVQENFVVEHYSRVA